MENHDKPAAKPLPSITRVLHAVLPNFPCGDGSGGPTVLSRPRNPHLVLLLDLKSPSTFSESRRRWRLRLAIVYGW